MRVIVHPGFHKTGTSTIQTGLRAARTHLPDWAIALREDIPDASAAARAYSLTRDPMELGLYQAALADWADALPKGTKQAVISIEGLSGHMPGRDGVLDYAAAPALMAALAEVFWAAYGSALDLEMFLTIRETSAWIDSLHWQHVRTGTLGEPLTAFRARLDGFEIAPTLRDIETAVAPARVTSVALEETLSYPRGPLTPLLDRMGISLAARAPIEAGVTANARPSAVDRAVLADTLAAINAEGLPREAAQEKKRDVLRAAWREEAEVKSDD
ncbi:hypothetical protein [Thioclava pacifica]|uniref:Sulfotransferase family protein n=1 Tax=Thioclava pacifica DSM 10166 TaxID=1353537 RepID=A0A074JBT3_9RHOB|nr:hypothetical protein [Thioclava pacifica]KEO54014.1 hypothetical protein TP2_03625 [Thioclava pacifica DSM 10166]